VRSKNRGWNRASAPEKKRRKKKSWIKPSAPRCWGWGWGTFFPCLELSGANDWRRDTAQWHATGRLNSQVSSAPHSARPAQVSQCWKRGEQIISEIVFPLSNSVF
jgi:hypothetical protein